MNEIIKKAEIYALEEISKNEGYLEDLFNLSNQKGQEIAEKLDANKDLVMLGTIFMDFKLAECLKEDKYEEHIERSVKSANEFLNQFDLEQDFKDKVINCIEAHHKTKEYSCIEAEICANADCYRMLHPRGMFSYLNLLGKRFSTLDESIDQLEYKVEEKHKILSLDICKEELEKYYLEFKELIKKSRI